MRLAASLFYILVLLFYLCTDLLYCLVSRAFILVQKKNCNLIASIKLFISFILYVYIRMHFVTCSVKASKSSCTWQTFTDSPNGFSKVFFVIFFPKRGNIILQVTSGFTLWSLIDAFIISHKFFPLVPAIKSFF